LTAEEEVVGSLRPASGGPLTFAAQTQVLRSYLWVEQQLFETLGSWVTTEDEDSARVFFDVQSRQHAWHAELFDALLPVPAPLEESRIVGGGPKTTPDGRLAGLFEEVSGSSTTILRLSALLRVVLPRMVTGYSLHLRRIAFAADQPTARTLRLVLRDAMEAFQGGEELLEEQYAALPPAELGAQADRAGQALGRMEEHLARGGPGLVALPA